MADSLFANGLLEITGAKQSFIRLCPFRQAHHSQFRSRCENIRQFASSGCLAWGGANFFGRHFRLDIPLGLEHIMDVKVFMSSIKARASIFSGLANRAASPENTKEFHMLTNHAYPDQFDQVRHEHEQLRRAMDCIHGLLADPSADGGELRNGLAELDRHLAAHFVHEEEGGYFAEVLQIAPRYKSEVDGLLSQHPLLREMLSSLLSKVDDAPLTMSRWQDIANGFERFVEHFIEHETDENDLLQKSYCQDIGAED